MKLVVPLVLLVALSLGCQKQPPPAAQPAAITPTVEPATPPADPIERWSRVLAQAEKQIEEEQWDQAAPSLEELKAAKADLDAEQQERLTKLEEKLAEHRRHVSEQARQVQLTEATRLIAEGKLEDAQQTLNALLAAGPSDAERNAANTLKAKIEAERKSRRKLATAMRLLASTNRGEIRAAQEQLWSDAEAAIPLLAEAAKGDNPVLVANALEMLRVFNQPERALPVMLGVLANPAQQASWPAAIRELAKLNQPGAGESLLKLALELESPEQRLAVLTALAAVADPPSRTLVALLPAIEQAIENDSPELPAALTAARHTVAVHRLADALGRRGFEPLLTEAQEQQLAALPQRLASLSAGVASAQPTPAAQAALALAIALKQVAAAPLAGVKVLRTSGEEPASPASATLDGVWNEAALDKLWRYPLSGQASIVFDLGAERTVSAVRIWNYNEASAAHRGWKEVDIYVSNSPALLNPIAGGLVPPAPGGAAAADYSITLAVPFARGRYVKLQPRSAWRDDAFSGLTEVQVLGF